MFWLALLVHTHTFEISYLATGFDWVKRDPFCPAVFDPELPFCNGKHGIKKLFTSLQSGRT